MIETVEERSRRPINALLIVSVVAALAIAAVIYLLWRPTTSTEPGSAELDDIAVVVQQNRNRLVVSQLRGTVTTVRNVSGGVGGMLHGKMKVRQPFSVAYHVNMDDLTLRDFIWDERTRTLIVRAPAVVPDAPNIDESKQEVAYEGPVITRSMQTKLREQVARGAAQQAATAAASPERLSQAQRAARIAIERNYRMPLSAAGVQDVNISVSFSDIRSNAERWDVSRSIEEVLAERSR